MGSHGRTQLTDDGEGSFAVCTTDGATYLLDLDARTVLRADIAPSEPAIAGDGLVALATCRVGVPMVMLIDRHVPGVAFTRRMTAPVERILSAEAWRRSEAGSGL